ncbi:MAG: PQQ-binding-like beta-propeller repeat protein [Chloroflexota bacterium]|nr:PQQ-binding-like beta-propeller repeat protein [Chloroflexota bacterium]
MSDPLSLGETLGRFRIEEQIGRGGTGIVYRAVDPSLQRTVAIKLLAPYFADDAEMLARFHREATAAANLKHANIAMVYEFGERAGQPYIVYEWIEGQTLTNVLQAEPRLPSVRVLRLFDQLAAALDYAHARGVIHRDLKPSNIIVGNDDHATIVDFGLAWVAAAPAITASGTFFGTPRYTSPEQIAGQPADGRSDLYSLAIVVYEMLAGCPPFTGEETPALLHKHLYEPPPPITELNPALPAAVETALNQALAKNPTERFADAASFGAALHAAVSPRIAATRARPARKWLPAAIAFLVACVCLVAAAGAFSVMPFLQTALLITPTPVAASTALLVPTPTLAVSPTLAATIPITAPLDGSSWAMSEGDPAHTGNFSPELAPLKTSPRWTHDPQSKGGTGLVIYSGYVVFGVDGGKVRALDWATGQVEWETSLGANVIGAPALYADDSIQLVFIATEDRELHALNLDDGKLVWRKTGAELRGVVVSALTIGDDGALYAATDTGWLHSLQVDSGKANWSLDLSKTDRFLTAPATTNVAIFVASANSAVYALDPTTHDRVWKAQVVGTPSTAPTIIESVGMFSIGTEQGQTQAFSMVSGKLMWTKPTDGKIVGIGNDGSNVYAASANGSVYAFKATNGEVAWTFKADSAISAAPVNDGKRVIVGTLAGQVHFVDPATGQEDVSLRLKVGAPITYALAPAGGWLFVRASQIYGFGP